jgi:hypothetical protein
MTPIVERLWWECAPPVHREGRRSVSLGDRGLLPYGPSAVRGRADVCVLRMDQDNGSKFDEIINWCAQQRSRTTEPRLLPLGRLPLPLQQRVRTIAGVVLEDARQAVAAMGGRMRISQDVADEADAAGVR